MRNRFEGKCYRCGLNVLVGDGHAERYEGHWRVVHASCVLFHKVLANGSIPPDWYNSVRPGTKVIPDPLWNVSSGSRLRLNVPSVVLEVEVAPHFQNGVGFHVRNKGGEVVALSAGWFWGIAP